MSKLLLLSGGIDSIALAYWEKPEYAITVDYGQRAARAEFRAAAEICSELNITHEGIQVDCRGIGAGIMSSNSQHVLPELNLPPEWWPFRNQLLISIVAARAIVLGAKQLLIGTVLSDRRHKDGSPEFILTMNRLLEIQEGSIQLLAPAQGMTSFQLVQKSDIPTEILAWAHSCHKGNVACGECPGCIKNQQVWAEIEGYKHS